MSEEVPFLLAKCPFCGNDPNPTVHHSEDYYAYVVCGNCGVAGPTVAIFELANGDSSKTEAIKLWNQRTI